MGKHLIDFQGGKLPHYFNYLKLISLVLAALLLVWQPQASLAQAEAPLAQELEPLLNSAKEKGLSVIVVSPNEEEDVAEETGPTWGEQALKVRSELSRIISKAPQLGSSIVKTLERVSPDGSFLWLGIAVLTAVGGIAIGTVPAVMMRKWARGHFSSLYNPEPKNRAEKLTYLMYRALIILFNVSIMAVCAVLIAIIFDSGHGASRGTIGVIIGAYTAYRIFRHVIFFNLIAPDAPSHRMINLNDEDANMLQNDWRTIAPIVIVICAFFVWLALLGMPPDPLKLLVMGCLAVSALIIAYGMLKHKKQFQGIILGVGEPSHKPIWRRFLA